MTIDEQIKVLQAYKEGKEIEQSTFIITKSSARINNAWNQYHLLFQIIQPLRLNLHLILHIMIIE